MARPRALLYSWTTMIIHIFYCIILRTARTVGSVEIQPVRFEFIQVDGHDLLQLYGKDGVSIHYIDLDLIGTSKFDEKLFDFCKTIWNDDRMFLSFKSHIHKQRRPYLMATKRPDSTKDDFFYVVDQFYNSVLRVEIGRATAGYEGLEVLWWGDMTTSLSVGRYTTLSDGVMILLGGNHCYRDVSTFPFDKIFGIDRSPVLNSKCKTEWYNDAGSYSNGPVQIGNDVHVEAGVTISSGVTIGDGAIIKSYSVIRSSIPAYAIASGNPSSIVGYRYSKNQISDMLQIQWWNWTAEEIVGASDSFDNGDADKFILKHKIRISGLDAHG
jgi:acetyltransferase-like isoleucine patch superfamily enzyme